MKLLNKLWCLAMLMVVLGITYSLGATTAAPEGTVEPEGTGEPEGEPEITATMVFEWIQMNPEYTAMIGMALMIILLVVTAICLICCLSGRNKE